RPAGPHPRRAGCRTGRRARSHHVAVRASLRAEHAGIVAIDGPRARGRPEGDGAMNAETRSIYIWRIVLVVAVLGLWQLASGRWVNTMFISSPIAVANRFAEFASSGKLLFHASYTAFHALAGFALGALAGTLAGIVLGRF